MRNYHVLLADNTERNVKAADIQVEANGTLWFLNEAGERILAYAATAWEMVEVERLDDKGASANEPATARSAPLVDKPKGKAGTK